MNSCYKMRLPWRQFSKLLLIPFFAVGLRVHGQTADSFNPVAGGGYPSIVNCVVPQLDGKVLAGGIFTTMDGQTRRNICRFNEDDSLDTTFTPPVSPAAVNCLAVQRDGMILVGGSFLSLVGQTRNRIGRLNATGTLDTNFNPNADGPINCLVVQPDKRILVGGSFGTMRGTTRVGLARLNYDGTLDSLNAGLDGSIYSISLLSSGEILVGGTFSTIGGRAAQRIAKLHNDGSVETSFNASADSTVQCLMVQPDGKVLVGGNFTLLNGESRNYIGRLNSDGTVDFTFNPNANGTVYSMALQADGKILIAGDFTNVAGETRNHIARIQNDGTLDQSFDPNADRRVLSLGVRPDGKVFTAGEFTSIGGEARGSIARLYNSESGSQTPSFDDSTITWTLTGVSPDFSSVSFDLSTHGNGWTQLGYGQRIASGWQISAPYFLPADSRVRVRGESSQGYHNGSPFVVEDFIGGPVITAQPVGQTNYFNTSAEFSVSAEGTEPLSFQWIKNGADLLEGGKNAGVARPTLKLSNVTGAEAGGYAVVIRDANGSVTSSIVNLVVHDPLISSQPTNQMVNAGQTVTFKVSATGSGVLGYQWRHDGTNLPVSVTGSQSATLSLSNVQAVNAGTYDVVVSNAFGTNASESAQLLVNLSLPDSLNALVNNDVYALALQPDNKIIFGGSFSTLSGQSRPRLARLNTNGIGDSAFNPQPNGSVFSSAVQMDGKILVGGWFTTMVGQVRTNIARLQPDGSLDLTFDPNPNGGYPFPGVYSILLQPEGKILVMGSFTNLAGMGCTNIGRLNPDGTLDPDFRAEANNVVYCAAIQSDGKILVGGDFTMLGNATHNYIGRLNEDGSVDTNFNASSSSTVLSIAVQSDDRILVGGVFTNLNGVIRTNFGRLNLDGSLDDSFISDANGAVRAFALQADGGILVGGDFTTFNGEPRLRLCRLDSEGLVDSFFNPGASATVYGITVQPDGKILVGGSFTSLAGQSRSRMGRLSAISPPVESLSFDGSTILWSRQGGGPEICRTTFEISTNGVSWMNAGCGQRVADGWKLTGLEFPPDSSVRARGFVVGGRYNASTWFLEKTIGSPVIEPIVITGHPQSRTNNFGTTAVFSVNAVGTPPLSFRWLKDGAPFASSDNPQKAMLTLSNVVAASAGGYSVIVSNSSGSVTSQVALLTVLDPFITQHPGSQTNNAGTVAIFSVTDGGSLPRTYQWWKGEDMLTDGDNISGATSQRLSIENVLGADAGEYFVTVTSTNGSIASQTALLTVNDPIITTQPANQSANPGSDINFSVAAFGSAPLSYQWRKDGQAIPNGTNAILSLMNLQSSDAGIYHVIVTNAFSSIASKQVTLSVNEIDLEPLGLQINSAVYSIAPEAGGSLLIGGSFTSIGGSPQKSIGRLLEGGLLDTNFHPLINGPVYCISPQVDGKLLIGGMFTTVEGQTRTRLARLEQNGALDPEFNPTIGLDVTPYGTSSYVNALITQPDGKILVGGAFTSFANQQRRHLARLNADGTLDEAFDANIGDAGNVGVVTLGLQADGKILVGGNFPSGILRLNSDGTLDTQFNPAANGTVWCLLVQPDGKILVGGSFTSLAGQPRSRLGRLNSNGTLDASFNPTANNWVDGLALQADGKIIVAGRFTTLAEQPRAFLGRLENDGLPDTHFAPFADNQLYGVALDNKGQIWAAGEFTTINGLPESKLARLTNGEAADLLRYSNSTIVWTRDGSSPELLRVTFESSVNGTQWQSLGEGSRVAGGWSLIDVDVPVNSMIRARGFVQGGYCNGSSWFVESIVHIANSPLKIDTENGFGFGSTHFGFNISGAVGQSIIVEGSSNLLNWIPISTNILEDGQFYFAEPALDSRRFYRLRSE